MANEIIHVGVGDLIVKGRRDDGSLDFLTSKASGPDLDVDQQKCDPTWLAQEMPEWFQSGANLREMHQPIAAGVATALEQHGDDYSIAGHVVDPVSAAKVEAGVLQGLSIGIKGPKVRMGTGHPPGGTIVGGRIVEVSLVDRPANPSCKLTLAKSASADNDELEHIEYLVEDQAPDADQGNVVTLVDRKIDKRDVSDAERKQLAKEGKALPDGSYPIANAGDLKAAVTLAQSGHGNVSAAKRLIKRRARQLGRAGAVPDDWKVADTDLIKNAIRTIDSSKDPAKLVAHIAVRSEALGEPIALPDATKAAGDGWTHDPAALASVRDGLAQLMKAELDELMEGEDEMGDVSALFTSLQYFLNWWGVEAREGEDPPPFSANDSEDSDMVYNFGVEPDLVKRASADDATDEDKAAVDEAVRERLGITKLATSEAVDGLTKAVADLQAELAADRTEMAEVKKIASPGGPARTRTEDQVKAEEAMHKRANATRLRQLSESSGMDVELSQAYARKAAEIEASI